MNIVLLVFNFTACGICFFIGFKVGWSKATTEWRLDRLLEKLDDIENQQTIINDLIEQK